MIESNKIELIPRYDRAHMNQQQEEQLNRYAKEAARTEHRRSFRLWRKDATPPPEIRQGRPEAGKKHRPRKLTVSAAKALDDRILQLLTNKRPLSLKQLHEAMTDEALPVPVRNDDAGYQKLRRRVVAMQQKGVIPSEWIAHHGRLKVSP